jgi:hypothetical protein
MSNSVEHRAADPDDGHRPAFKEQLLKYPQHPGLDAEIARIESERAAALEAYKVRSPLRLALCPAEFASPSFGSEYSNALVQNSGIMGKIWGGSAADKMHESLQGARRHHTLPCGAVVPLGAAALRPYLSPRMVGLGRCFHSYIGNRFRCSSCTRRP